VRRIIKLKILYESYQGGTSHNTAELMGFLILKIMKKFYHLKKTELSFRNDDVSFEFNEYVKNVFYKKNKIFIVFVRKIKKTESKNLKSHIKEYYIQKGFLKVKFLYF
jgi:hypothetical protein